MQSMASIRCSIFDPNNRGVIVSNYMKQDYAGRAIMNHLKRQ